MKKVILTVVNLYIITKGNDNDNDDENNAQNKDIKKYLGDIVYVNDHF